MFNFDKLFGYLFFGLSDKLEDQLVMKGCVQRDGVDGDDVTM